MKKWKGKGKFYCVGLTEYNGKIRSVRDIEAEDRERARPLIAAEVLKKLGLPQLTYLKCITVSEVEEMKDEPVSKMGALISPLSAQRPRRSPPPQVKKGFLI